MIEPGAADTPAPCSAPSEGLRVLMISDVYFPRVNGVSTSIATFRQQLARLGHRVDLLAPDYGRAEAAEPGIVRIPAGGVPFDPEDRRMRFGALLKAAARLATTGYDLIHIQTPFVAHYAGLRLARRWRLPVVASYHTFFEEYLYHYVPLLPRAQMRALARWFSRRQCNVLDGLLVPSTPMRERLRRYGVATPITVLPTGIEPRAFSGGDGARFRARHGIGPQRPVLLFVGRVAHEKNIGFLLKVVAQVRHTVPDVLLLIAGEGPALGAVRREVRAADLERHVTFVGYLSRRQDLQDCYRAGDVFVFASRTETQGLVLLEAMDCGLALVSTAVMGTADVLAGSRGAVIAPEEVDGFAQRVVLLLRDARLRHRLGQAARGDVERWSASRLAMELAQFYARLVACRKERAGPS